MKASRLGRWALGIALVGLICLALVHPALAERPLVYSILPGDTLPSLATRFGIPLEGLLRAHGLAVTDALFVGDALLLPLAPAAGQHTIAPGQTLQEIADLYQVAPLQLAWRNGLPDPQRLIAGRTLVIPDVSGQGAAADTAIARPTEGQRVRGTIQVSGWGLAFDNELLVQLYTADGAALAQQAVGIHAEIGQLGAFSSTLELPADLPAGQALILTVSRRDRQTGELTKVDEVALTVR